MRIPATTPTIDFEHDMIRCTLSGRCRSSYSSCTRRPSCRTTTASVWVESSTSRTLARSPERRVSSTAARSTAVPAGSRRGVPAGIRWLPISSRMFRNDQGTLSGSCQLRSVTLLPHTAPAP